MRLGWLIVLGAAAVLSASCSDSVTERAAAPRDLAPFSYPTAPDRYESDDSKETAGLLRLDEPQWRSIYPEGDYDWMRVELRAGNTYEFTASHLSVNGDTYLYLYDTDGTTLLESNDDCVGYDSCLQYTPDVDGNYYLAVGSYIDRGLMTYRLEVHPFVDEDGDGWSTFHDCNDTDPEIHPKARDIAGDGIDQNCTGTDALDPTLPDLFEEDQTPETATAAVEPRGSQYEYTMRPELFPGAQHTLHSAEDADWYKVVVPPHQMVGFEILAWGEFFYDEFGYGDVQAELQETPGIRSLSEGSGYLLIASDADEPVTVAVRVGMMPTADPQLPFSYLAYVAPKGYDRDGDFYGTMGMWGEHDCDDGDPAVNDDAIEIPDDGIDQDCDGVDGTTVLGLRISLREASPATPRKERLTPAR